MESVSRRSSRLSSGKPVINETVVPIPSAKAKVVSAQPPTSYVLTPGVDGKMELHITDPVEFRRVRQVVIVTA